MGFRVTHKLLKIINTSFPRCTIYSLVMVLFPLTGYCYDDSEYRGEWTSEIGFEATGYPEESDNSDVRSNLSTFMSAEYYYEWNDGWDSFVFSPRLRLDQNDEKRNIFDISELSWIHVEDTWEIRTGIRQVSWGVALAQPPVDVINQTSFVEGFMATNSKLGQPMVNLSLVRDWGILDFYIMAGFREQVFPGESGRPGFPIEFDDDETTFPFEDRTYQGMDFAVRWQHSWDAFEWALSYFDGTSRDPSVNFNFDLAEPGVVASYYPIRQLGLELIYIYNGWQFKFENATTDGQYQQDDPVGTYTSSVIGLETTFGALFGSNIDVIVNVEYLLDDRKDDIVTFFEHDVMLGLIFPFNDAYDTRVALLSIWDPKYDEGMFALQGERRIAESWKLGFVAVYFAAEAEEVSQDVRDAQTEELVNELISEFELFGESELEKIIESFGSILQENSFRFNSPGVQNALNNIGELQDFAFQQPDNKLGILETESSFTIQLIHYF